MTIQERLQRDNERYWRYLKWQEEMNANRQTFAGRTLRLIANKFNGRMSEIVAI